MGCSSTKPAQISRRTHHRVSAYTEQALQARSEPYLLCAVISFLNVNMYFSKYYHLTNRQISYLDFVCLSTFHIRQYLIIFRILFLIH